MPIDTKDALSWIFQQNDAFGVSITTDTDSYIIVDKSREYFNANGVKYDTFSFADLVPFFT